MTTKTKINAAMAAALLLALNHANAAEGGLAMAQLSPTDGSEVSGSVSFEATGDGVHVTADLSGLTPGNHGFHIHQWGDCSSGDGKSAGGHFNPGNVDHAGPDATTQHVGDMGNLTADESGNARYDATLAFLSFEGDNSIIGRGVIVHAGMDDLESQPTGDAGGRKACGVIGLIKGK